MTEGVIMPKPLSRDRMIWAINETRSMRQAAKLLNVAYNTFKKYAKLHQVWNPNFGGNYKRGKGHTGGFKQVEIMEVLQGKNPSYSTAKLQYRLVREGYLEECCSNCGFDEYRTYDMTKPLQLDYIDDDQTNKDFSNLRLLCFNCYYILKVRKNQVEIPSNVKTFTDAINTAFSTDKTSDQTE